MKIKNIDDLRNHAIDALEKLSSGKIDVEEAGVTGKLCESVMSTLKLQVEVAKMLGREPNIPFLGKSGEGKIIDVKKNAKKQLNHNGG